MTSEQDIFLINDQGLENLNQLLFQIHTASQAGQLAFLITNIETVIATIDPDSDLFFTPNTLKLKQNLTTQSPIPTLQLSIFALEATFIAETVRLQQLF